MSQFTALLYTALTFGATGIAAGTLQEAGRELYVKLKGAVVTHMGGQADLESAVDLVEKTPDSTARQALLQEELDKAVAATPDIANDNQLTTLAQQLIDLLGQDGSAGGSRNISINENKGNAATGDNVRQIQAKTYIEKQTQSDD